MKTVWALIFFQDYNFLNVNARYIEKEGPLQLLPKGKEVYLILFNDMLLITEPKARGKYTVAAVLSLSQLLFSTPVNQASTKG